MPKQRPCRQFVGDRGAETYETVSLTVRGSYVITGNEKDNDNIDYKEKRQSKRRFTKAAINDDVTVAAWLL